MQDFISSRRSRSIRSWTTSLFFHPSVSIRSRITATTTTTNRWKEKIFSAEIGNYRFLFFEQRVEGERRESSVLEIAMRTVRDVHTYAHTPGKQQPEKVEFVCARSTTLPPRSTLYVVKWRRRWLPIEYCDIIHALYRFFLHFPPSSFFSFFNLSRVIFTRRTKSYDFGCA